MDDDELASALGAASGAVRAGEEARVWRAALVSTADRRGWTQQRIAAAAGVSQQAIAKMLRRRP